MAEKRFISRRITESEKIRTLAQEGAFLATSLYQWLLPYTDREGRVNANAYYLLGGIFLGYDFTPEQINQAIDDLARVGLVHLYANGRYDRVIQYTKFTVTDGGFNKPHDREAPSNLPGPADTESKAITPSPPQQPQVTNQVRDKVPDQVRDQVTNPAKTKSTPPPGQSLDEVKVDIELELKTEIEKVHARGSENEAPPGEPVEATPRPPTTNEPKRSKGKKPKPAVHEFNPDVVAEDLPEQFDRELFLDFCRMRLKIKAPMTLEALKQFLRKHQKHPKPVLDEMFRNAIVASWKDLWPPKAPPANSPPDDTWRQYTERGL